MWILPFIVLGLFCYLMIKVIEVNADTIDTVETNPEIREMNLTHRQLIDYLLDLLNHGTKDEKNEAYEKLMAICPKRQ